MKLKCIKLYFFAFCTCFTMNVLADDTDAYLLSPFDEVEISVYGEPELDSRQRISDKGSVSIPLLGELNIGGMTISEALKYIESTFISRRYLLNPVVTFNITQFVPKGITILGEVENPGLINIPAGKNDLALEVAIAEAGGFTDAADKGEVQIHSSSLSNYAKINQSEVVDFNKILQIEAGKKEEFIANPDDLIYVPRRLF